MIQCCLVVCYNSDLLMIYSCINLWSKTYQNYLPFHPWSIKIYTCIYTNVKWWEIAFSLKWFPAYQDVCVLYETFKSNVTYTPLNLQIKLESHHIMYTVLNKLCWCMQCKTQAIIIKKISPFKLFHGFTLLSIVNFKEFNIGISPEYINFKEFNIGINPEYIVQKEIMIKFKMF
jgi:hypothetical protein